MQGTPKPDSGIVDLHGHQCLPHNAVDESTEQCGDADAQNVCIGDDGLGAVNNPINK